MNRRAVPPAQVKAVFSFMFFAVVAAFSLCPPSLHAQSANALFKRGESAEAREDYDTAFINYQKAAAKAPKDLRYRTALYRVRVSDSSLHLTKGRKLVDAGDEQAALVEFLRAAEIDPGNEAAQQEIARVRSHQGEPMLPKESDLPIDPAKQEDLDSMGAPVQLKPLSAEPLTLHYSEDAKTIYQAIGKAAGINVLFDPALNSKRIQVDVANESLLDALRIVGALSSTFWKPVTQNTIFVAENTRAKHTELDEQAVQTFYLTNAWQQNDLNDVQTALRNVLGSGVKVNGVPSQNAIVMRGTPDELLLAQKLINDLDKARPEVVVDIAILEVSKNWEKNIGLSWPTSVGLALQAPSSDTSSSSTSTTTSTSTSSSSSPTLYDLAHLKAYDFAVSIGSAQANMLLTDSNTKILQNPRIRATDSQKATTKIGSRIPIATGSTGGGVGGISTGVSTLVQTQFQYLDVGVNVEMTPTVHFDHDVTLKMKIEVTSQSGSTTISSVTEPIISQRTVEQVIRLREGEASILGGILNKQDQVSWGGLPGLSSIPIFKYLFGSKDHTVTDDEIVFLVVPHIVRSQELDAENLRTIDTGSGQQTIELRHMNPPANPAAAPGANPGTNPGANPPVAPPARPASLHSQVGTVPGQSAQAAAPAALAQLRDAAELTGAAAQAHQTNVPTSPSAPPVSFLLTPPPQPVAAGTTFQLPVVLTNGTDVSRVPLKLTYDPAMYTLINVNQGDLLGRDGQATQISHNDDGPGNITINLTRPAGTTGITGSGTVCILTFQAKAAGESVISLTRGLAVNSHEQSTEAQPVRAAIQIK
jgi:general secretion pathway protein D